MHTEKYIMKLTSAAGTQDSSSEKTRSKKDYFRQAQKKQDILIISGTFRAEAKLKVYLYDLSGAG